MENLRSNRRSDEQLEAIMWETGHWVVNGPQGRVLGSAANLRHAIDKWAVFAASGAVVVAICRLPSDNIIVFPGQIDRLCGVLGADGPAEVKNRHTEPA